ncbi:hypothetical protein GCM10008023_06140 [Sphingomonas glacialis]|uniref:Uncharacterized protein n=1 Tax=Sphingomonas glacialis TaxID=658225 RepID=A0ABQ3L9M6_9SPHN|nr:hypothetical protein [Sphingomonas glacialis]GHH09448.1 hypothetical protein GCM10008023_06140 [Sphingomonas glacialis]
MSIAMDAATFALANDGVIYFDHYRQAGDADDTQSVYRALAKGKYVKGRGDRTYTFSDLTLTTNAVLDLTSCTVFRGSSGKYAVDLSAYHGELIGGDFVGQYRWARTTITAAAAIGAPSVTVADASKLQVGMYVVHASTFESYVEPNLITGIMGNVVSFDHPLRGAVSGGEAFHAGFPMIITKGGAVQGAMRNSYVRQCLFGVQTGAQGVAGGNTFTFFDGVRVSDYVGAAFIFADNSAGENVSNFLAAGGRTQTLSYTATAGQTRFAFPFEMTKRVWRWGTEPSIRATVNGTTLAVSSYTVDTATGEIVLSTPCAAGDAVVAMNIEVGAFGIMALGVTAIAASSIERMTAGLVITTVVGQFIEDAELGFIANVQTDTSGYAAALIRNSSSIHHRASDFLYSPKGVIYDGCTKCSLTGGFSTSQMPDADEFVVTSSKREIDIRTGSTGINVAWADWTSSTKTYASGALAVQTTAPVSLTPFGLSIGGVSTGRLALYGTTGNGLFQVSDDCQAVYLGGSGYNYFQATSPSATLRIGSVGSGGRMEFVVSGAVPYSIESNGRFIGPLPQATDNADAIAKGYAVGTWYKKPDGSHWERI